MIHMETTQPTHVEVNSIPCNIIQAAGSHKSDTEHCLTLQQVLDLTATASSHQSSVFLW
jgi:hypothetical protein